MMNLPQRIWQGWKRVALVIGDWIARLFLTLFYFTIFLPFGIGVRLFGDPLALRSNHAPQWIERNTRDKTLEDSRRLS